MQWSGDDPELVWVRFKPMATESEGEAESSMNEACFIDCHDRNIAAELLSELVGCPVDPMVDHVTWRVDNKYYTADIRFTICSSSTVPSKPWEAILLLCDLTQPGTLERACGMWERMADNVSPGVCLLVCVSCLGEDDPHHQKALEWCVGRGFELVEWQRGGEGGRERDGEEGGFLERTGVERISEALQAHVWPQMTMKREEGRDPLATHPTNDVGGSRSTPKDTQVECEQVAPLDGKSGTQAATSRERIDDLLSVDEEEVLAKGLSGEQDPGGENFEQLFARFAQMKAHADSLPHEERKKYAEKVVTSFWKAIGGDDDEINSDSDN